MMMLIDLYDTYPDHELDTLRFKMIEVTDCSVVYCDEIQMKHFFITVKPRSGVTLANNETLESLSGMAKEFSCRGLLYTGTPGDKGTLVNIPNTVC